MAKGVVYGATVTDLSTGEKETYTGLTEGTMRDRISKHKSNCRHKDQPGTRLSTHVWKLKDRGAPYSVTWQILSRASSFFGPKQLQIMFQTFITSNTIIV